MKAMRKTIRDLDIRRQTSLAMTETFAFLGFIHYCGLTRDGRFIVKHTRCKGSS